MNQRLNTKDLLYKKAVGHQATHKLLNLSLRKQSASKNFFISKDFQKVTVKLRNQNYELVKKKLKKHTWTVVWCFPAMKINLVAGKSTSENIHQFQYIQENNLPQSIQINKVWPSALSFRTKEMFKSVSRVFSCFVYK